MRRERLESMVDTPLLWLAMAGLALLIFVADTVTDLEIAVAVLHVAVVLISVWTGRPRTVLIVGLVCSILTVLSFFMTVRGDTEAGIANSCLSLLAIGATTYLAIRIELADLAVRRAEADLARISRITMLGELTASIAHEVSQPLAAIGASSNAALRWLSASPPNQAEAQHALKRIVEAAERAGEVVERVRRLVRRAPPLREPVDMVDVIDETLALMRGKLRANAIPLRTELLQGPLPVMGDRVQLQQVLLNFITNAIEATVDTKPGDREIAVNTSADDREVSISVTDTGPGLSPQAMEHVFDPFFTTKEDGMGIGLAISRSIIEAHGGSIEANAAAPRGSVFRFTLPLARGRKD
ncbi:GHKL domain-containing protein [Labrys sp. KNU-23]|uniref:sensor histidine kinase n=1 Tax=Labrys sp. KNU-23 TaxID=2789216 RepID=UPI0011ED128A|nr:ATP-binding protein [Labrys sp. KNU-23]QEN87597.1 GHKL domain-containing protein [Labrys sp. KNU-23]